MLEIYDYGFRYRNSKPSCKASKPPTEKRGKVKGFSHASRLRLREWLLMRHIPCFVPYGITLTIPRQDDMTAVLSLFEKAVHRLRVYFLRHSDGGYVWRVELQVNRMPHLHLVAWLPPPPFDCLALFLRLWHDIVSRLFTVRSLSAFLLHGCVCSLLDGNVAAYRYLSDHSSKRKQAQLGYKGRQWGVVGRSRFVDSNCIRFEIPPCLDVPFRRFVRRFLSFRVNSPCVFGCKHIRKRGMNAVSYVDCNSVVRFIRWHLERKNFCKGVSNYFQTELPF